MCKTAVYISKCDTIKALQIFASCITAPCTPALARMFCLLSKSAKRFVQTVTRLLFFCKRVTTVLQKLLTNFRPFGPLTASKHYIPILCSFCHLSNSSNFPTFFYFVFFHGISSRDIIEGFFQGIFQGISSWDFSKGFFHGIFLKDFFMEFLQEFFEGIFMFQFSLCVLLFDFVLA